MRSASSDAINSAMFQITDQNDHMNHVSQLALRFGRALGYSTKEQYILMQSCRFHDIGKREIPKHIIEKRAKLTVNEFEIMKTHTQIGAEILSKGTSEWSQIASVVALTHHEWFNGSGYPNKLYGDEIPFAGRICAICDVYDALISVRTYKRSWNRKDAIEYIESQKDKQFDANLVNIFLKIKEKW